MKPPAYLTDRNQLSRLAIMIVDAHPRGYVGTFVEGPRRSGKTVFCMRTAHQVFQYKYGINRDDAWEMVLDNIVFSIAELDQMFERLDGMNINSIDKHWLDDKPIMRIWDDVGMHGGKYRYLVDAKYVDYLQQNLDIIGVAITGLIMNAPELSNVLNFLRDYHDHRIVRIGYPIDGGGQYDRVAYFSNWRKEKQGWKLRSDKPHTPFSCYLGDVDRYGLHEQWVYDEYEKKKIGAIQQNRQTFKKMLEFAKKSEPTKDIELLKEEMGLDDQIL